MVMSLTGKQHFRLNIFVALVLLVPALLVWVAGAALLFLNYEMGNMYLEFIEGLGSGFQLVLWIVAPLIALIFIRRATKFARFRRQRRFITFFMWLGGILLLLALLVAFVG